MLLCLAMLGPATVYAIPVTYEFTGQAHLTSTVHGFVTFDTDAVVTDSIDTIGDGTGITSGVRWNEYANPIVAVQMDSGSGNFDVSGGDGTGGLYAHLMIDSEPNKYTEWDFGASISTVDDGSFGISLSRRCDFDLCPASTLDALFAYDDLLSIPDLWGGWFTLSFSQQDVRAIYNVTSFTKVPEPSTAVLFAIGALGLAVRRYRMGGRLCPPHAGLRMSAERRAEREATINKSPATYLVAGLRDGESDSR